VLTGWLRVQCIASRMVRRPPSRKIRPRAGIFIATMPRFFFAARGRSWLVKGR